LRTANLATDWLLTTDHTLFHGPGVG